MTDFSMTEPAAFFWWFQGPIGVPWSTLEVELLLDQFVPFVAVILLA